MPHMPHLGYFSQGEMQYRVGSNCIKQRIANTRTRLLHVVKSRRGATEECLLVGEILTGKTNLIVCVAALKDNGLFGHAKKKTKGFRKQAGRMINSGLVSTWELYLASMQPSVSKKNRNVPLGDYFKIPKNVCDVL